MPRTMLFRLFIVLAMLAGGDLGAAEGRPPNVLLVVADDLGYSDLGCYGGEIETPNLDSLANHGLRFTRFYNTARCWPTRGAILTGYYAQQIRRDTVPGLPSGSAGARPEWARLLPDMLRPLGYRSYQSGKWHVDRLPLANGFDRSYVVQDQGRFFGPRVHYLDDEPLSAVSPESGFYGTIAIADHAVKTLKEHAAEHAGKPFFHYLAFTAPHFPLQALEEDIARYRDRYRAGWDQVRAERLARQRSLGIFSGEASLPEREVGPPYDHPEAIALLGPGEINRPIPWSELTEAQRDFQAAKMAIHAAMVDRVDRELGRVLDQLRAMNAFDDTLIFFLSDNGASAEIMVRDDGHDPLSPMGSAASYLCLGPGWSTVANTPFRRHKTWVHEGGISTPLVVHWPNGVAARGELRANPGHVIDLVPTILDIVGGKTFAEWNGKPVPTPPGKSLAPAFAKDGTVSHADIWWAHNNNRAIRVGDWKLVSAGVDGPWELYNLADDRIESRDLAATMPDKARELESLWNQRFEEFCELARRDSPPLDATPSKKNRRAKKKNAD